MKPAWEGKIPGNDHEDKWFGFQGNIFLIN
jgi:hypothetical protein